MGNGLRKAISNERWGEVRHMLEQDAVKRRVRYKHYYVDDSSGNTTECQRVKALHLVLRQRAPVDVVTTMIEIDDGDALREPTQPSQELPLHYAVRHKGSARRSIVNTLVARFPEATRAPSVDGSLPLHIACSKRRPIALLRLLVGNNNNNNGNNQATDDVRTIVDFEGNTAWDLVKKNSRCWEVLYRLRARRLLKVNPVETNNGEDDSIIMQRYPHDGVEIIDGEEFHTARAQSFEDEMTTGGEIRSIDLLVEGQKEDDQDDGLCVLCWDGDADHVLIPCGHICLCERCSRKNLSSLRKKCPVCNKPFERSPVKVYHAGVVAQS